MNLSHTTLTVVTLDRLAMPLKRVDIGLPIISQSSNLLRDHTQRSKFTALIRSNVATVLVILDNHISAPFKRLHQASSMVLEDLEVFRVSMASKDLADSMVLTQISKESADSEVFRVSKVSLDSMD